MWGIHQLAPGGGGQVDGHLRWLRRLALVGCVVALAAAWPARAGAVTNPIGAHSMLQLNSPYSFMQTMFAEAVGMHASAIRLDVAPALVFPTQGGPPDFSGLDEVMALSQQYHLRVVADLFTIPPWMAGCSATDAVAQSRCPPADEAAYGPIITQIVSHADPVIRDWEIWNEPDTGEFYSGTPQQYALMLRTAHDAIKAVDPGANVLLGGISSSSGMSWLAQVFATPGAGAATAFDIANVHERGWLDGLAGDLVGWRWFLSAHGFSGPIWVTEHGYPADPSFQFDPHYNAGPASQAAYLTASVPSLVDAGAGEVFITERDNLGAQYASEGLLGGDVADPPVADPQVVPRPAYTAVAHLADCYTLLGRDCPAGPAAVRPAAVSLPQVRLGRSAQTTVTVSDPGNGPLLLGPRTLTGPPGLSIAHDSCPVVLEPDETCAINLEFAPSTPGAARDQLQIPSDGGLVGVNISTVATSVSGLSSPQLPRPTFATGPAGDGVGIPQQLVLDLANPMPVSVHIGAASLSGPDAARFRILANTCRGVHLAPHGHCRIAVWFVPDRLGAAEAVLALGGDGVPLLVPLGPTASPPPAIRLLAAERGVRRCAAPRFVVVTSQPSVVSWSAVRAAPAIDPRCLGRGARPQIVPGSRASLRGRARTGNGPVLAHGRRGYVATVKLRGGLFAGLYRLTMTPVNAHGCGSPRVLWAAIPG